MNGNALDIAGTWAAPRLFLRHLITCAAFIISRRRISELMMLLLARLKTARVADSNDPFELESLICLLKEQPSLRRFKESYNSETGFLSFSANWTNPVLWGHYGDKHRGICLGFDVPTALAKEVEYIPKRTLEKIDWSKFPNNIDDLLTEKLSRTKFADWAYEKEYRLFVKLESAIKESGLYFYPFGDDLQLVEVILGPRCNLSIDAVQRLTQTRYPHPVTFQARKARQHFAIVPERS
jgi:hypothetical protein